MLKRSIASLVIIFSCIIFLNEPYAFAQASPESDLVIISGTIKDAATKKAKKTISIQFADFNDSVVTAKINGEGTYQIVLSKEKIKFPTQLVIAIDGYEAYTLRNIDGTIDHLKADLFLKEKEQQKENQDDLANYDFYNSPFSPFVLR